jgi:hypothetical protein
VRDQHLDAIRTQANQQPGEWPGPIVFEGNAPADIGQNTILARALATVPAAPPAVPRIWLGAPNSIKGPTEVIFQRQSGAHLLVVGQSEEAALSIIASSLISLGAQYPRGTARLILLESTPPGSPEREFLDQIVRAIPHEVLRPRRPELAVILHGLANEVKQRTGEELAAEAPTTFVIIADLQEFKTLRQEDEFSFASGDADVTPSPAASFATLVSEGAARGVHLITTVDTHNNVSRHLGRKGLSEFQVRVLFQMSPSDSASLIDSPEASKLGLHRALLYNEREGYIEKFRPYALPESSWIDGLRKR